MYLRISSLILFNKFGVRPKASKLLGPSDPLVFVIASATFHQTLKSVYLKLINFSPCQLVNQQTSHTNCTQHVLLLMFLQKNLQTGHFAGLIETVKRNKAVQPTNLKKTFGYGKLACIKNRFEAENENKAVAQAVGSVLRWGTAHWLQSRKSKAFQLCWPSEREASRLGRPSGGR